MLLEKSNPSTRKAGILGHAMSISADSSTVVAEAMLDDDSGSDSRSAYIYIR
jgi:hypothetical protein